MGTVKQSGFDSTIIERVMLLVLLSFVAFSGRGVFDLIAPEVSTSVSGDAARKPQGIRINEITLRDDGSGIYDRQVVVDGAHYAWTGQVFRHDGSTLCQGGETWKYPAGISARLSRPVNWLVGDDCSGIEAGMTYLFTYTSVDGKLRNLRYPRVGLGTVIEADNSSDN